MSVPRVADVDDYRIDVVDDTGRRTEIRVHRLHAGRREPFLHQSP